MFNAAQKFLLVSLPVAKFQQCLSNGSVPGAVKMHYQRSQEVGSLLAYGSWQCGFYCSLIL